MAVRVVHIHSSAIEQSESNQPNIHEPTDIIVYLSNGQKYIASFFSYAYFQQFLEDENIKEETTDHLYFWHKNMILSKDCRLETVRKVVEHLLEAGDFWQSFEKL